MINKEKEKNKNFNLRFLNKKNITLCNNGLFSIVILKTTKIGFKKD